MSTYLLVHGAWHGGWCWEQVAPFLTRAGHRVLTPDLPAMGVDPLPVGQATFAGGMQRLQALVDAETGPVIVVGHSMGGMYITQLAEDRPGKLARLAYLTAFIPDPGESALTMAARDSGIVRYGREMSADKGYVTVRDEWIKPAFYGDCPDEQVAKAKARLKPQALEPFAHPVSATPQRAGTVPRVFIECLRDHAITAGAQRAMYTRNPCERVLTLDTSHSPFLSAPQDLARALLSL